MIAAFIPVRLSSSRLAEKHLLPIGDRPLLSWVISRLRAVRQIERIVICAPNESASQKLAEFARAEGVDLYVYPGEVNDVVGRLTNAARQFNADICVLASGDCPLLSTSSYEGLLQTLLAHPEAQVAHFLGRDGRSQIHEGMLVMRRSAWEWADRISKTPAEREHHFILVRDPGCPGITYVGWQDEEIYYRLRHRISVDTPSDLRFMAEVYQRLSAQHKEFNLANTIELLLADPSLIAINSSVKQKGINDRSQRVLMIVSAIANYGQGNLRRALAIAEQLVDGFGMGVTFRVCDEAAAHLVERHHFAVESVAADLFAAVPAERIDGVVLDLNSDIVLTDAALARLRGERRRPVVVIDNLNGAAKAADQIIIPTAHYGGPALPNLVAGAEFVVLREAVRKLCDARSVKRDVITVYCHESAFVAAAEVQLRQILAKEPHLTVEWSHGNAEDFPVKLVHSRYFVAPFGLSAYEALYLGARPVLLPRNAADAEDIKRFMQFADNAALAEQLGNGALQIAKIVKSCLG